MLHVIRVATAICLLGPVIALTQDAADLAKYVGSYKQPNIVGVVRVRIQDGHLAAQFSGRPPISMTHVSGHEFRPEGRPDWKIVFDVKNGRAVGYTFTSPEEANLGSALLQPGFLKRETLDMVFGNSRASDGTEYNYAMGWTTHSGSGPRIYGHGGNQPGGRCYLLIYPDSGLVLAILRNMYNAAIGRAEAQIIAEPFDRLARGISPRAPVFDPVGVYELNAERDSRTVKGTLRIWETRHRWTGSLAFEGRSIRLPMVAVSGNEMRCIGFDRRMTVLNLDIDGSRVTGTSTSRNRGVEVIGVFTGIKSDPCRANKENGE